MKELMHITMLDQFICLGINKETMHANDGGGDPNKGLRRANEHKTFTINRSLVEHRVRQIPILFLVMGVVILCVIILPQSMFFGE